VGGLPAGEADVVLRHQAWPDKHRTVALRPGETATLEFQGGRGVLAGRLTRGGEPVAGAGIHIKGLGGAGEQVWATAGDDGRFRQGGLEPGRYEVGWRLPGDASFLSGPGREVVEVGEGETVIDLEAAVPGRLGGRVVRAGTGEAVAGAEVTLQTDGAELFARGGFRVPGGFWLPAAKATSDAAGRFEFAVSARGRCFLNAAAAGVQGWLGPFDLEPAALPGELEIEIGGAGRLDATVIDEGTGGAVGGALVIIKSEADVPIRVAAKTDATGRASLEAIRPGAYRLEVQASASITWRERLVLGEEPVARTVRLEPASWIVLELGGGSDPARRAPPGNLIVAATALEGPDPIWNLLSVEGERPREMANFSFDAGGRLRARLKTRAGKYRLAIEVHRDGTHLPPLGREEVEIEVPRGGEVLHRIADSWTRGL
jgi:hypothetical protein